MAVGLALTTNVYHGKNAASADRLEGEDWDLLQNENDPAEDTNHPLPPQPIPATAYEPSEPNEPEILDVPVPEARP
jgi:hypothetical protein